MERENNGIRRAAALTMIALLLSIGLVGFFPVSADGIPDNHHVWLEMTNGARFSDLSSGGVNDSYYFKFDGGGLNALHITNSSLLPYGQLNSKVSTSGSADGTFYISDTGGRGFDDDIILMVAVKNGYDTSAFNLHINASGYQWDPTPVLNQIPDQEDVHHFNGTVDEDFTAANFTTYDAQYWKPYTTADYPLFANQYDTPAYNLSFIDLKVGALGLNTTTHYSDFLLNNGTVKVDYSVTGLETSGVGQTPMAFNAYAWCNQSNQDKGVSWTNDLTGTVSGWEFNSPY